MTNLVIAPLFLPLLTALVLVFFRRQIMTQRWISAVSMFSNVTFSAYLIYQIKQQGILTLHMSGWLPPFGIVFVADLFAGLLVLTTSVIGLASLFYAFATIGEAKETHYFYPFLQFLMVGVIGSFLTGDIFNLFVCFEVMLISSYALIVMGGSRIQLRESLTYILINIISSTLFVASVAYLYAVTGTLNMAQLSLRISAAEQAGILTVIAVLFLIVFSLKAGLFLFYWLPGSYRVPPAVITALFAGLLTKVGIYAIIRLFTLIFAEPNELLLNILSWLATATMLLGALGAIAYRDVYRVMIYNIVAAIGFLAFGLSLMNATAWDGMIYYLIHDMIAKTLLFMLGGMLVTVAGTSKYGEMGGLIKVVPQLGWMLFIVGLAIVGIPPLSGFIGKLLIIQGGLIARDYVMTGIALVSSLLILYSMLQLFMRSFWGEEKTRPARTNIFSNGLVVSTGLLFMLILFLGLGAEWVYELVQQAGYVLVQPQIYIDAVLKE